MVSLQANHKKKEKQKNLIHNLFLNLQDSLRKKQQPPVSSTPVSVPSPQPQTFNPPVSVTNTALPTVQSLQQPHIDVNKEVSNKPLHKTTNYCNRIVWHNDNTNGNDLVLKLN